MYDVDMTKIDIKLDAAFLREAGTQLTPSEVIRLRRYINTLREELRELNREHLKVVNESVPMEFVRRVVKDNELLAAKLSDLSYRVRDLEYSGKGFRCPICFRSLGHAEDCWLGSIIAQK